MGILGFIVAIGVYIFFCYCLKLIVEKTGHEPGILIWIPIANIIPLLNAAGMNTLWILGFFVPILNIILAIYMWIQISNARGKGPIWGILMIVPFLNIISFLYLAFSD